MSSLGTKLRVLVVDDSALYRKIVRDVIASLPGVEVVGVAKNGREALMQIGSLRPDAVTLDLEMPELDGIGVLREMRKKPDPPAAIMVSAFTASGAASTTTALQEGAFDFILKPATKSLEMSVTQLKRDLAPKLQACQAKRTSRRATPAARGGARPTAARTPIMRGGGAGKTGKRIGKPEVIGIGISTGGPQTLTQLLPALPASFPVPILLVQHMPPMFTGSLARDLDRRCKLTVAEAQDGQPVRAGEVLIAPGGKHMRVGSGPDGKPAVQITNDPPERNCKPAVDYLFRSLAQEFGPRTLGVVLTGMGDDGAAGCVEIKKKGGSVFSQDEESCVVYGMPRAVAENQTTDLVLPLNEIAARLTRVVTMGVLL